MLKNIYNVFTEINRAEIEQVLLGIQEYNERPEILQTYLKNHEINPEYKEVVKHWNEEIYGHMYIIGFDGDYVTIYCEETKQLYQVQLLNKQIKKYLIKIHVYQSVLTRLVPIY